MIYVYLDQRNARAIITPNNDPTRGTLLGTFEEMPQGNPPFIVHALLRKNSITLSHGISVVVEQSPLIPPTL